ncbi:unnamed protein product [Soboliphyme baturini]|uniref:Uracil-DNA glycosylase n=1 Tax=Soboliphyme baturini TaxID=241478 RepID=A0A3P8CZ70_9BILA|nr:unnamed protein product [Soboliphyme baturini]
MFVEASNKKQRKIYSYFKTAEQQPKNGSIEVAKSEQDASTTNEKTKVVPALMTQPKISAVSNLTRYLTEKSWRIEISAEFSKPYFREISNFLEKEYQDGKTIYPPKNLIFNAFNLAPMPQVKVVILGQDPYHGAGQAHGLSFSVPVGIEPPPSLKNIYTELTNDIPGFERPSHGCLTSWAQQGVLLLNATLTVQAHLANSHANIGWQNFTDAVIHALNDSCYGVVFLLWGAFAHKKEKLVNRKKHVVIKTAHPSPLSATKFFGCRCFSRTNEALVRFGKEPIDWRLN